MQTQPQEMVKSMLLHHYLNQNTILLVQIFPFHVILNTYWLEATLVLVLLMAPGMFHIQPVDKVMKPWNVLQT